MNLPSIDGYGFAADYSPSDPTTWDWSLAARRWIGVDIGMASDHSAWVGVGAWRTQTGFVLATFDSHQFPLGTAYEEVVDEVAAAHRDYRAKVVVDCSNAAPFLGLLAPKMLDPKNNLVAVSITSAKEHNLRPEAMLVGSGAGQFRVPRFLLSKMMLLQTVNFEALKGALRPAHVGHWQPLQAEVEAMELQELKGGSFRIAAPSGRHDDMVLALALAVWACHFLAGTESQRPSHRRPPPPSPAAWT